MASRSRFPDCAVCGNAMHGRALLTRCLHPVCLECAAPHFKELKDYKCPDCNTFEHILAKFYTCLADSTSLNIRAEAERIRKEEDLQQKNGGQVMFKSKLDRLHNFDRVGNDLAKVGHFLLSSILSVKT